jgi:site-specific recombinase XerD
VGAAWDLSHVPSLSPEQAFCSYKATDGKVHQVSSGSISKTLKRAASKLGLNQHHYASHSLRRGGATAMFLGGAKDLTVQLFGRWKSDAYKAYTCIDTKQLTTLAARMTSTTLDPTDCARCCNTLHH